jgi:hypothetical protein
MNCAECARPCHFNALARCVDCDLEKCDECITYDGCHFCGGVVCDRCDHNIERSAGWCDEIIMCSSCHNLKHKCETCGSLGICGENKTTPRCSECKVAGCADCVIKCSACSELLCTTCTTFREATCPFDPVKLCHECGYNRKLGTCSSCQGTTWHLFDCPGCSRGYALRCMLAKSDSIDCSTCLRLCAAYKERFKETLSGRTISALLRVHENAL